MCSNEDPIQPKINKQINLKKNYSLRLLEFWGMEQGEWGACFQGQRKVLRWPSQVHAINSFKLFIHFITLSTRKAVLTYTGTSSIRKQCSPPSSITLHMVTWFGEHTVYLFVVNLTVKNLHATTILICIYLMTSEVTLFLILALFLLLRIIYSSCWPTCLQACLSFFLLICMDSSCSKNINLLWVIISKSNFSLSAVWFFGWFWNFTLQKIIKDVTDNPNQESRIRYWKCRGGGGGVSYDTK